MTSAAQEILGQDEIDALIHGMGSGDIPTEAPPERDEARGYDFSKNTRIVRGRMPTLEMINERFGRLLRTSIYNLLRRAPVISVGSVQIVKFGEYVRTLHLPTSLNLVRFAPLREVLDSGMQSDRVEQDDRWSQTLKHEVGDAPVEVRALLGHTTLKLSDLMNMRPGDVLSTDFSGTLTLIAEDIPMFRGAYGLSHGQQAVQIEDLIRRIRPASSSQRSTA
jgi:flagellar motor switch protein FliM